MVDSRAMNLLDRGEFTAGADRFAQTEELWRQALQAKPAWSVAQRRLAEFPQRRRVFPHEQAERERRAKPAWIA